MNLRRRVARRLGYWAVRLAPEDAFRKTCISTRAGRNDRIREALGGDWVYPMIEANLLSGNVTWTMSAEKARNLARWMKEELPARDLARADADALEAAAEEADPTHEWKMPVF